MYRDFVESPAARIYHFAFALLLALAVTEYCYGRFRRRSLYDWRDTSANLSLYLGFFAINLVWIPVMVGLYMGVNNVAVVRFTVGGWHVGNNGLWWEWLVLFLLEDLCFYWFHRCSHRCRLLWASHVTHHSSQKFNFSVAIRQTWFPFFGVIFWLPLPLLGFDPLMVLTVQLFSLLYQDFLHTQLVPHLGPLEWLLNTPRHHRVHHASNERYLDRNYGGVLILWDRLFRTYANNRGGIRYGLTSDIDSHNPLMLASHEFVAIWRDLWDSLRCRRPLVRALRVLFAPPGAIRR